MNNIMKVVESGICTGCRACSCEHITFEKNKHGFPSPIVDESCTSCGECLKQCIYFDEDVGYYIFEEFDSDCVSFLHENTLNMLRLSGVITQEIVDMALELSRKFRALEGTELWNVQAVRNSEKWLEVLELSDRIKEKLTAVT